MSERFRPKAAVYVLLKRHDDALLIRRFQTGWQDGNYTLPAGHIDEGETASQCAIRECLEEVNVHIAPQDLHFFHLMHRKSDTGDNVYVDFYFYADRWQGEIKNNEPQKCDDVRWFSLKQLPENMIPHLKEILSDYFSNKVYYAEKGWGKTESS
jgi:8-oxo-dGTP diphosphatase